MKRRTELRMWMIASALGASTVALWLAAQPKPLPQATPFSPSLARAAATEQAALGDMVLAVVANDPFRIARRPSDRPYGSPTPPAEATQATVVPSLRLAGVVGPPWRAMIEGFPGRDGSVVLAVGDTIHAVRVRQIRMDAVLLSSADTTWLLPIKRGWR